VATVQLKLQDMRYRGFKVVETQNVVVQVTSSSSVRKVDINVSEEHTICTIRTKVQKPPNNDSDLLFNNLSLDLLNDILAS